MTRSDTVTKEQRFMIRVQEMIYEKLGIHIERIEMAQAGDTFKIAIILKRQLSFLWPAMSAVFDRYRFDYRYLGDLNDTRDFDYMRYNIKYHTALMELDEEDFELWRMLA